MNASVRLRLPGGAVETLYAGDLIGRTWAAALRLDDPDISEAHAMVSLRGERLWLLALRRRFSVGGKATDAVPLTPGLRVRLAPSVDLEVTDVTLPDSVLGLEGPGLPAQALPGTCSLVFDPHPRLAPGALADARAVFWATDGRWRVRLAGGEPSDLDVGGSFAAAGTTFCVVTIALSTAGQSPTRADDQGPLRIVASFDTVQVHRADGTVVVLAGQLARVVSELASVQQPMSWEELARQHWPHLDDRDALRRRWDGLLGRLRERLREVGVRADLVASTRIGLVELVLREGDVVVDRG
ncbi:MAG: hypothetical protein Q8P18_18065 [Pseudomonadota bacterium]|nr:hypothetical protein [Pseudomonadota bacterium]